jgi:hypothetical protein
LHEVVEYTPSLTEWKVTAGIWALGLLLLTVILKIAVAVFTNEMKLSPTPGPPTGGGPQLNSGSPAAEANSPGSTYHR